MNLQGTTSLVIIPIEELNNLWATQQEFGVTNDAINPVKNLLITHLKNKTDQRF